MIELSLVALILGLLSSDILDRWLSTRRPQNTATTPSRRPWYGRDAAAATRTRPDLIRSLVQLVLALALGSLAFRAGSRFPRSSEVLGAYAAGVGCEFAKQFLVWWVMPLLWRVKDPKEQSRANRLFPLEQGSVQAAVCNMFRNWPSVPSLKSSQADVAKIEGPLKADVTADSEKYTVEPVRKRCLYTVRPGDDLESLCRDAGVDEEQVRQLNPNFSWEPGRKVVLPFKLCSYLVQRENDELAKEG